MNKKDILLILKDKKVRLPLILFAFGVLLLIIPLLFANSEKDGKNEATLTEYRETLEKELADLCSDIDGVGKCRVFITLERGAQYSYKGSEIVETKPPKVLGVTVVCKGADKKRVEAELVEMITALFDIGSNRVAILKLN